MGHLPTAVKGRQPPRPPTPGEVGTPFLGGFFFIDFLDELGHCERNTYFSQNIWTFSMCIWICPEFWTR